MTSVTLDELEQTLHILISLEALKHKYTSLSCVLCEIIKTHADSLEFGEPRCGTTTVRTHRKKLQTRLYKNDPSVLPPSLWLTFKLNRKEIFHHFSDILQSFTFGRDIN